VLLAFLFVVVRFLILLIILIFVNIDILEDEETILLRQTSWSSSCSTLMCGMLAKTASLSIRNVDDCTFAYLLDQQS